MENNNPVRTLIVGHCGQYPFLQQDFQGAIQATVTDPENYDDDASVNYKHLVWEDIVSVDEKHIVLSTSGPVLAQDVYGIKTTQPEEEIDVEQRLADAAEVADYGFDNPHELY